jgi:hypothetical protein
VTAGARAARPWRAGRRAACCAACRAPERLRSTTARVRLACVRRGPSAASWGRRGGFLSGAGRVRADPWTFAPTSFSNQYFVLLRDEKWCALIALLQIAAALCVAGVGEGACAWGGGRSLGSAGARRLTSCKRECV